MIRLTHGAFITALLCLWAIVAADKEEGRGALRKRLLYEFEDSQIESPAHEDAFGHVQEGDEDWEEWERLLHYNYMSMKCVPKHKKPKDSKDGKGSK